MKFDSSGMCVPSWATGSAVLTARSLFSLHSTRRYDSKMFFPRGEKEVFDLLGLEWVAPEWRNADA